MAEMAETFNEMLDRLDRALSSQRQLLRDVGHELRTPLTVVRGHLEQLDDDPARRDDTIALLLAELDRMATLVTDLRTLAQSERADFLRRQPVDAGELVRQLHRRTVDERGDLKTGIAMVGERMAPAHVAKAGDEYPQGPFRAHFTAPEVMPRINCREKMR